MTEKDLISACERNEVSRVLSLLEDHYSWFAIVSIFFRLREKKTSSKTSSLFLLKSLDCYERTLLHFACLHGRVGIIAHLLKNSDVDVNKKDNVGMGVISFFFLISFSLPIVWLGSDSLHQMLRPVRSSSSIVETPRY
jgi:hypothetical protein